MALVNKPDESIFASSAKQGEVDNFPDLLRGWGLRLTKHRVSLLWSGLTFCLNDLTKNILI